MKGNLYDRMVRILFGADFFISYARKDGSAYADNLVDALLEQGYTCFFDQLGTEPGKQVPNSLLNKVKRSSVLVLLGTDEACKSSAVGKEIETFVPTKRPIVPVNFGQLHNAIWFNQVQGISLSNESRHNLDQATPSSDIADRIVKSMKYRRQSSRIRTSGFTAAGLLLLAIAGIILFQFRLQSSNAEILRNEKQLVSLDLTRDSLQEDLIEIQADINVYQEQLDNVNALLDTVRDFADRKTIEAESNLGLARLRAVNANKLLKSVEDGIWDLYRQPKLVDYKGTPVNRLDIMENIFTWTLHIYTDQYMLRPEAMVELDKIIQFMHRNPQFFADVRGHTSKYLWLNEAVERSGNQDEGAADLIERSHAYSRQLSENMAQNIGNYLLESGIDRNRVMVGGFGQTENSYSLDLMNNRVEVQVYAFESPEILELRQEFKELGL